MSYTGEILKIDLSGKNVETETREEKFYRKYMGGSAIGAYYLLKELPFQSDPLGPENIIVISASVVTGAPISGFTRANVTAKSPLTGGVGDSQFGGFFPLELKKAGFDAIVVKGKAKSPVYILIQNGEVKIKNAGQIWGMDTGKAGDKLKEITGDRSLKVLSIGQAGENKVKYASIINEKVFAAGRTGMGAVMGSKNLKAIAVSGEKSLKFANEDFIKKLAGETKERLDNHGSLSQVSKMGSSVSVEWQNESGGLPTRNFQSGHFEKAEEITGKKIYETLHTDKRHTCFGCVIACKQRVGAQKPYKIDDEYGCPEYETASALGSYLMIDDVKIVAKANELCNRYGLDTISVGAIVAFCMECYEKGLMDKKHFDGIEMKFGNGQALLDAIEKIAAREGYGNELSHGMEYITGKLNENVNEFAMHVKNNPLPAHMPRVKQSYGLAYATVPFGADHCSHGSDAVIDPSVPEEAKKDYRSLGILEDSPTDSLKNKAKFYYYTGNMHAFFDTADICIRAAGLFSYNEIVKLVRACTGWETSLWELMKIGERRNNMLKMLNASEGFTAEEDVLPDRAFKPIEGGPTDGVKIDKEEFYKKIREFYELAGWNIETGRPKDYKLRELGLEWTID